MSQPENKSEPHLQFAKEKGEVLLRDHVYDGIQEFDQKLPNWWLFTFYAAIIWFLVYWFLYYQTKTYQTDGQRITQAMNDIAQKKAKELEATLAKLDDKTLVYTWAMDQGIIAAGEATYATNCVACHGADLSATMAVGAQKIPLPGLPLNDGQWKFDAHPMGIFKLINEGSPATSTGHNGAKMVAWGQTLSPKQIAEVVAFIISKNKNDFSSITP